MISKNRETIRIITHNLPSMIRRNLLYLIVIQDKLARRVILTSAAFFCNSSKRCLTAELSDSIFSYKYDMKKYIINLNPYWILSTLNYKSGSPHYQTLPFSRGGGSLILGPVNSARYESEPCNCWLMWVCQLQNLILFKNVIKNEYCISSHNSWSINSLQKYSVDFCRNLYYSHTRNMII